MDETRFDLVAAERRSLADLLEGLSDAEWATPSLCDGWTVREVAVHVMVGPTCGLAEIAAAMVRARGSFHRANRRLVDNRGALSHAEVVAVLRDRADSRFTPPGMTWTAPLTDVLVHSQDIAVPLGRDHDAAPGCWEIALDLMVSRKGRGSFVPRALPDLTYAATDADWTHGSGPVVSGPAAALGLALTGRSARLDRLDGPGAERLRDWVG